MKKPDKKETKEEVLEMMGDLRKLPQDRKQDLILSVLEQPEIKDAIKMLAGLHDNLGYNGHFMEVRTPEGDKKFELTIKEIE